MLTIPRSRVVQFYRDNPEWMATGQRFGQVFYHDLQLEKVTNDEDKTWCDALYNADSIAAQKMVIDRTDWEN